MKGYLCYLQWPAKLFKKIFFYFEPYDRVFKHILNSFCHTLLESLSNLLYDDQVAQWLVDLEMNTTILKKKVFLNSFADVHYIFINRGFDHL